MTLNAETGDYTQHEYEWGYTINDSGMVFLESEYRDDGSGELIIPEVLEGKTVTGLALGDYTPANTNITKLKVPKTVTSIEMIGYELPNCEEIEFYGDGEIQLEHIGRLTGAGKLAKFNAGTVDGVYYDCVIPSGVTSMKGLAFMGSRFESVYVPESLSSVTAATANPQADIEYGDLKNGANVTSDSPFYFLEGLVTFQNDSDALIWLPGAFNIESFQVPEGVEEIPNEAFKGCANLKSVSLPSTLARIGDAAFADCSSLQTLDLPDSLSVIGEDAFRDCSSLTALDIPDGVDFNWSFRGCASLQEVKIPSALAELPIYAFEGCSSLKSVTLPAGIESIPAGLFKDCASLESVKFGSTEALKRIESQSFNGTSALQTLAVPDSVTFIGAGAFANSGIESIVLPSSLWEGMNMSEQGGDFNKDPSGINIGDTTGTTGHMAYGAQLFVYAGMQYLVDTSNWNYSLKSVDLSNYSQTAIPYYMFAGCASLEEVRIPSNVRTLYEGSFADCVSLKRVYLYNDNPDVAGASSTGDTGDGSGGVGEGGWTEHYPSAFGYHVKASEGANLRDSVGGYSIADYYEVKTDMTLYGVGFKQNSLLQYAEKYGCKFIPFAFLGDGGKSAEVKELFGYEMPANTVSVASVKVGETPVFELVYQDAEVSRTLEPGTDCEVAYYNAQGQKVSLPLTQAGTYTAKITGDNDSVWGTASVSFTVSAIPSTEIVSVDLSSTGFAGVESIGAPGVNAAIKELNATKLDEENVVIVDANETGMTAEGSLILGEDESAVLVTKGFGEESADYQALLESVKDNRIDSASTILGAYDATLLVGEGTPYQILTGEVESEEVHEGFGTITLSFPVDQQYNGYYVYVHHMHNNGTVTTERVVAANGMVTVTVTDLSQFVLELGKKAPVTTASSNGSTVQQVSGAGDGQNPAAPAAAGTGDATALAKTGDPLPVAGLAVVVLVAVATVVALAVRMRTRRFS